MKKILLFTIALMIILNYGNLTFAGRISDYNYEGNNNNIIVANRTAGKQIALTFDDGPCPMYTGEILSILRDYKAKATFFVIGKNAEMYPELIIEAFRDGHEIGNHTYSHPEMRKINKKQLSEEISKTQEIIKNLTNVSPILFRPPGGYLNNSIVDEINSNNCKTVLWSWRQDTKDWTKPAAQTIVTNILSNLNDGDIILFHDYNTKGSTTPEALRLLLPKLLELGYKFVTVSQLVNY